MRLDSVSSRVEVDFESERTCELQLSGSSVEFLNCIVLACGSLFVAQRYGWKRGRGASDMQPRPRFCKGVGTGVLSPDVEAGIKHWTLFRQRVQGRLGIASFRPECIPQLGLTYDQKTREV